MSDLATLKKAIGLYVTMTPYPKLAGIDNTGCKGTTSNASTWDTANDKIYYSYPSDAPGAPITATSLDGVTFTSTPGQVTKAYLSRTDGSGWIPIDFSTITGGSPISVLPVDPINTIATPSAPKSTDLVYRYTCSEKTLTYEISATLESSAYTVLDNKMTKDGGTADSYFEVGTMLSLLNAESPAPVTIVSIGDSYGGGKVAYILQVGDPGYSASIQHGLIAATVDQSSGIVWSNAVNYNISVPGTLPALGTGLTNTNAIVTQNGAGTTYAAGLARAYTDGSYVDWYLPSKDELNKLYLNRAAIGGFASTYYWSSSEGSAPYAWYQYFTNGSQGNYYAKDSTGSVRAVRAF